MTFLHKFAEMFILFILTTLTMIGFAWLPDIFHIILILISLAYMLKIVITPEPIIPEAKKIKNK